MIKAECLPLLPVPMNAGQAGKLKELVSAMPSRNMLVDEAKKLLGETDRLFGLSLGVGLVRHAGKGQGVRIPCRDVVLIEDLRGILALTKGGVIPHGLLKKFPE